MANNINNGGSLFKCTGMGETVIMVVPSVTNR